MCLTPVFCGLFKNVQNWRFGMNKRECHIQITYKGTELETKQVEALSLPFPSAIYLFTADLSIYICLFIYLFVLLVCLGPISESIYLSIYLSIYQSIYQPKPIKPNQIINQLIYLSIHQPIWIIQNIHEYPSDPIVRCSPGLSPASRARWCASGHTTVAAAAAWQRAPYWEDSYKHDTRWYTIYTRSIVQSLRYQH